METKGDPKNEFLNKRILITGASSGIGNACAVYFLNCGAKTILCGRDLNTLVKLGEKYPDQVIVVNINLTLDLQIYDLKTTIVENFGGIDIIVNCAGILFDGDLEKTFPQDFDYTVDVNLRSAFILITSLKPYLLEGSSVINVSCLYGSRAQTGCISHCMSKAGLEALTKVSAAEFAKDGIRVNCVTSGPVDTNCHRYVGVSETEYNDFKKRVSKNIPLQRMARPDDIAKSIVFLASSRSAKITGQVVKVDGGRSLTSGGYVPWRGMKNMNARFEPDDVIGSLKIKDMMGRFINQNEPFPETEDDIERLLNESNWSTRLSDAHLKVFAAYHNIDSNDKYLLETYVKKNNN
jgi:NAD(P)-dependent dehydrogenase (short-subunit alcohol dehydrogenase family)